MIVIEQFSEIVDGKRVTGRREVERADVISPEEALRRQPAIEREQNREALRAQMQAALVDHYLGEEVLERIKQLREEYQSL